MLETYKDSYVERIRAVERQERLDLGRALVRAEHRYVNAVELASVIIVGLERRGKDSALQSRSRACHRLCSRRGVGRAVFAPTRLGGKRPGTACARDGSARRPRSFRSARTDHEDTRG